VGRSCSLPRTRPLRVKPTLLTALAVIAILAASVIPAHAENPPRFVYGGAEITRSVNSTRPIEERITLRQGRQVARYLNAVVVHYLRAMEIPYEANWDRVAACESGGNWSTNTGNSYYGGVQFSLPTWRSVGGSGYPHQNSKREQIRRAEILRQRAGLGQWPICGSRWYG
jgi:hypothetical protein